MSKHGQSDKGKAAKALKTKKGILKDPLFFLGIVSAAVVTILVINPPFLNSIIKKGSLSCSLTKSNVVKTVCQSGLSNLFVGLSGGSANETPDLVLMQENSVLAVNCPSFVDAKTLGMIGSEDLITSREEIIEYTVQEGDDISKIAENFGISANTIFWANGMTSSSKIKAGQSLIILPVSGVLHFVEDGESVSAIASRYKTDTDKIIAFNHLDDEGAIMKDDILVVPDGTMAPKRTAASVSSSYSSLPSSYFLKPVPSSYQITQGLHWFNAVDFSNSACGGPVYASAGGEVQKVGYNSTSGNFIRVIHPNGVVTYYGHLSKILVGVGQKVYQGQVIGNIGNTGYTIGKTGCHLHFAVLGAKNPFSY